MISLNKVVIAGNLTRDPRTRQSREGRSRAGLCVAVNHAFKGADGQNACETSFINVTAWNSTADRCLKHLRKGMPVLVEGRIRVSKFDARDGRQQYYTEVVAESITFLSHPEAVTDETGTEAMEAQGGSSIAEGTPEDEEAQAAY